jgi:hypothetical protein
MIIVLLMALHKFTKDIKFVAIILYCGLYDWSQYM